MAKINRYCIRKPPTGWPEYTVDKIPICFKCKSSGSTTFACDLLSQSSATHGPVEQDVKNYEIPQRTNIYNVQSSTSVLMAMRQNWNGNAPTGQPSVAQEECMTKINKS